MLAGCDNGCVEIYRVSAQNTVLCETDSQIQAHDDMVLGVALLAGGEKTVTVGQDRKSVGLTHFSMYMYRCTLLRYQYFIQTFWQGGGGGAK